MAPPPGNRLEALSGKREGTCKATTTCSVQTTWRAGSLRVSSHGKGLLSMGYWPNQALHRTALPLVGWGR